MFQGAMVVRVDLAAPAVAVVLGRSIAMVATVQMAELEHLEEMVPMVETLLSPVRITSPL
jgi:hypothetical protein